MIMFGFYHLFYLVLRKLYSFEPVLEIVEIWQFCKTWKFQMVYDVSVSLKKYRSTFSNV